VGRSDPCDRSTHGRCRFEKGSAADFHRLTGFTAPAA
jgi:hypothetical protein